MVSGKYKKEEALSNADEVSRNGPPVYPTGFRFGNVNDESLIIDFLDVSQNGSVTVFSSIVLSKTTARQLFMGVERFCDEKDKSE